MNEKSGPRRFRGANRYVIAGLATALPALAGFVLVLVGQLLSPLLSLAARPLHALTGRERRRAGRALGRPIPEPEPGASPARRRGGCRVGRRRGGRSAGCWCTG